MILAEVDNLLDDLVAGFGPLGEVEHVFRNLCPEERVSVLQQPSAVDSFGFASTEGRYPAHKLTTDARDTARTESTEPEFVFTVRGAANKDEVANGEGRGDYVGSLVVRDDGALAAKTHGMLDVFEDFIQCLLQLFNTDELQSTSAVDSLRAFVIDVRR